MTDADIKSVCCGLNNYFLALVQLKPLERRLERTPNLKTSYAQTIKDDFEKGYFVKVDKYDCFMVENPREWYPQHHPVLYPYKLGKVRRVLNGAAKFHGVSLKNALFTGPDLLQALIDVLMRFRQHPYAVSADIEGMFLQVGVIPQDRRVTHRLVPTMRLNAQHVISAKYSWKPRKVSKTIFTWTIILSRAQPLTKQPKKLETL